MIEIAGGILLAVFALCVLIPVLNLIGAVLEFVFENLGGVVLAALALFIVIWIMVGN
jgi:hypothetical protein